MQNGGGSPPGIPYDGVIDPALAAAKKGANPGQVCLANNGSPTFLNLDAAHNFKHPSSNLKVYDCSLPALEAVKIAQDASHS